MSDRTKPNTQQVARAGEHFVAGELHRRGAYAVVFSGNMPGIDVLPSDRALTRTVALQVKTKTSGTWHTTITRGRIREPVHDETRFWLLVDIGAEPPEFYVVPEWWMEDSIYREHQEYLARHGGQRAQNPKASTTASRRAASRSGATVGSSSASSTRWGPEQDLRPG